MTENNSIISKRLNVAYLFQSSSIKFSDPFGAELHIIYTLRELQKLGHHAALLALQPNKRVIFSSDLEAITQDKLSEDHYTYSRWSDTIPFIFFEKSIRKVQSILGFPYLAMFDDFRTYEACSSNLNEYTLIHERYNGMSMGGAFACRRQNIPYILEINADMLEQSEYLGNKIKGFSQVVAVEKTRFCFNTAHRIISVSSELKDHLIQKWNVAASKIIVLPCAADVDVFRDKFDTKSIKQQIGLKNEQVIIWVGGFYPWHNLDLLINSFQNVIKIIPDTRLVLIGDGKTRESIEQMIKDKNLDETVIFTGKVQHEKIPALLSIADIAVSPFDSYFPGHGGTPMKLFEYMAAGKPIVATNVSQVNAVIKNGYNGLLIEPGDELSFTDAIIHLAENPNERKRLGENAKREAIRYHSWGHYAERLESIYWNVLDEILPSAI